MASELEIRKEQRKLLFELIEIRKSLKEESDALDKFIRRHKAGMLEEDVAWVEKMINSEVF